MTQIDEYFEPEFFTSDFWFMWCTTFAFQPWHSAVEFKRYLLRFIQEFPRISTLAGVKRTPYNQYESIVLPLVTWLEGQGVHFEMNSQVTNLAFLPSKDIVTVERIHYIRDGKPADIAVRVDDHVMVTLGSMTAGSTHGSMDSEPRLGSKLTGGSWLLWESLAATNAQFGHPSVFDSDIEKSMWESFTLTLNDPLFFRLMKDFTGNEAGTGGLVTFKDSNWLMSIVLPRQPHFRNQPGKINVCWGYGLFPNRKGNFVQKTMSECTGSEILTELLSHLRFTEEAASIQQSAICIPVMMPFITSQFMPRLKGDRPLVRPEGSTNLAFIGQFCEIPDEVVFTVEYSVRSAQTAVFSLLNLKKEISPIYKGQHDLRVLFDSALAMFK
jgi:oleate hydratase